MFQKKKVYIFIFSVILLSFGCGKFSAKQDQEDKVLIPASTLAALNDYHASDSFYFGFFGDGLHGSGTDTIAIKSTVANTHFIAGDTVFYVAKNKAEGQKYL